jgi:hypothetical protein
MFLLEKGKIKVENEIYESIIGTKCTIWSRDARRLEVSHFAHELDKKLTTELLSQLCHEKQNYIRMLFGLLKKICRW